MWVEPGPAWPGDLAGDHPEEGAAVGRGQQRHAARARCPGSGATSLSAAGRFTHSWMPWNRPPLRHQVLRRRLDVEDPAAGGHPLGVPVGDQAAPADRVLVLEGAVDHVGDRLEPAVRVPRRALGLARRVLHLAHLVHVDERVEVRRFTPAKARRTGNPSPSKPAGAVVTETTGRSGARRRVHAPTVGKVPRSSTVTAGMANLQFALRMPPRTVRCVGTPRLLEH